MKFPLKKKILFGAALIPFIILGIAARSVELVSHNFLWGFDHGKEYLITQEIVTTHHIRLIGEPLGQGSAGLNGIFHGPGFYYLLAIPYVLFGGDPYGGIVLLYLVGLVTLCVGFILGRKLFGTVGALLLLTLLVLSPPLIEQTRSIWPPYPSTLFIIISFYFTFLISRQDKKHRNRYLFLASFFAGFIYNFELAIAVPLSIGLLFYYFFLFRLKELRSFAFLLLGFICAYSPMVFFEVRHSFPAIRGVVNYISHPSGSHGPTFIMNTVDHYGSFLFTVSNAFPTQKIISALVLFILLTIAAVYLLMKEKKRELKTFFFYLLFLIPFTFFILLFLRNTVYQHYLIHLTVIYLLLFVYCLMGIYRKQKTVLRYGFILIFIFLVFSSIPTYIKMIGFDLHDYGGDAKIIGKEDALDYIYTDAGKQNFGLLVFSPPVYTYPYDYLLNWYAKKKYSYVPPAEKKGLFYLLIEVDPAKPWSYKGWIETVVKSGNLVSETKLPSGFIVQKRFSPL